MKSKEDTELITARDGEWLGENIRSVIYTSDVREDKVGALDALV